MLYAKPILKADPHLSGAGSARDIQQSEITLSIIVYVLIYETVPHILKRRAERA